MVVYDYRMSVIYHIHIVAVFIIIISRFSLKKEIINRFNNNNKINEEEEGGGGGEINAGLWRGLASQRKNNVI